MKREKRYLLIGIVVLLLIGSMGVYGSRFRQFHYEKHLDEVVFTVNDAKITMQTAVYYVMKVEEQGNEQAVIYDADDPVAYWNLYMNSQGEERKSFYRDVAKDVAEKNCIMGELYAQLAAKEGITLDPSEQEECDRQAKDLLEDLTSKQKKVTKYRVKDLEKILKTNKLANKYVQSQAQADGVDEDSYDSSYGIDSDFYQEKVKENQISCEKRLWDKVSLGQITIN